MLGSKHRSIWLLLFCTILLHQLSKHATAGQSTQTPGADRTDDLDAATSKCAPVIAATCKEVEPGQGRLAQCVSEVIAAADAGTENEAGDVPDGCEEEVNQLMIASLADLKKTTAFVSACREDIQTHCADTTKDGEGYKDGSVLACLKEKQKALTKPCQQQVVKAQLAVANDYRADVQVAKHCKADAERLCAGVKDGGGRVQACLLKQKSKVSWECNEHLLAMDQAADTDLRFNVRLFRACLPDKKRFCPDADTGDAVARDCLMDAREEGGFSDTCREELEAMLLRRSQDFRLDTRLAKACSEDIRALCPVDEISDGEGTQAKTCLQDRFQDIRNEDCRSMIKDYQQLAAQDIRFDVPLADACGDDRTKLCANVPPGSARVIRCLQAQRDKLTLDCQATLFDEEVRFSDNIDFQYPMKVACQKEMAAFCKNIPHGQARVIRCLQSSQKQQGFGAKCLAEVQIYERHASQDYRLNSRLRAACEGQVKLLCKDAPCKLADNKMCGGVILRCLSTQLELITNDACAKEVRYFQLMETNNFNNDVIMAAACRKDVETFCSNVSAGEGRLHQCLDKVYDKLSPGCQRERMILEQQVAENIELRPNLLKSCHRERQLFCGAVQPGGARVFRCLAENLGDGDFGNTCRLDMIRKLQRRQANWRLDPGLRKACKADVADLCKDADDVAGVKGAVYQCLLNNSEDLDPGCKRELGRAAHMAMFIWTSSQLLTSVCDGTVQDVCVSKRPSLPQTTGAVLSCLTEALEEVQAAEATNRKMVKDERQLPAISQGCRALLELAKPPDMARAFDSTLTQALVENQLGSLEASTGVSMLNRDRRGNVTSVALTGWLAVAGMAALVVLVVAGGAYGYKRYTGETGIASTVVLKSRQVYKRVPSTGGQE